MSVLMVTGPLPLRLRFDGTQTLSAAALSSSRALVMSEPASGTSVLRPRSYPYPMVA